MIDGAEAMQTEEGLWWRTNWLAATSTRSIGSTDDHFDQFLTTHALTHVISSIVLAQLSPARPLHRPLSPLLCLGQLRLNSIERLSFVSVFTQTCIST